MSIARRSPVWHEEVVDEKEEIVWYAMRATYRRELSVKQTLDELSIESFIPMRYTIHLEKGRKKKRLVPVIHNLIFVHATPSVVKEIKGRIQHLQYMMHTVDGKKTPIIVPDNQMLPFIAITQTYDEKLLFLDPQNIDLVKGEKVRICGGALDGCEGRFIKVLGRKAKHLVISIQNIISVATAIVPAGCIEKIG